MRYTLPQLILPPPSITRPALFPILDITRYAGHSDAWFTCQLYTYIEHCELFWPGQPKLTFASWQRPLNF